MGRVRAVAKKNPGKMELIFPAETNREPWYIWNYGDAVALISEMIEGLRYFPEHNGMSQDRIDRLKRIAENGG